jgi:hypothetical protein
MISGQLEMLIDGRIETLNGRLPEEHPIDNREFPILKEVIKNYYKTFLEYLTLVNSWDGVSWLLYVATDPFTVLNGTGHTWDIGFENLHHVNQMLVYSEIDDFIGDVKGMIEINYEIGDNDRDIDWSVFYENSVLFRNDRITVGISEKLGSFDHGANSELNSSNRLNKLEFLLRLKSFFKSENFQWYLDLSTPGEIRKASREGQLMIDLAERELHKIRPYFFLTTTMKMIFRQNWKELADQKLLEITSLNNLIESNFIFNPMGIVMHRPYEIKANATENIKKIILSIVKILCSAGVFERSNKREVAFWLYFHFHDLVKYDTIEYYVYHK